MTPALRKYHRRFWLAAVVVFPVIFVAAIISLPQTVQDPHFRNFQSDALTTVLDEGRSGPFTCRLRSDVDSLFQLEIIIKEPLHAPETLVYLLTDSAAQVTSGVFIGKLSSAGTYRFPITQALVSQPFVVTVYNPFEHTIVDHIPMYQNRR